MDKHINYRMAVVAAAALGGIVFAINYSHGAPIALVAAGKQATYTFFVAGFITRYNENLAVLLENRWLSLAMAVTVSSCLAIGLTYLVHSLKGTPEPIMSTLPTIVSGPPSLLLLAWRAQQG